MLDRIFADYADTQRTALMQYCKMENVLPASLVCVGKPRNAIKFRLETTAFHVLQHMDKWLNAMIIRLTSEMEHSGMIQRRLS